MGHFLTWHAPHLVILFDELFFDYSKEQCYTIHRWSMHAVFQSYRKLERIIQICSTFVRQPATDAKSSSDATLWFSLSPHCFNPIQNSLRSMLVYRNYFPYLRRLDQDHSFMHVGITKPYSSRNAAIAHFLTAAIFACATLHSNTSYL